MPEINAEDVTQIAKDAVYVAVGAGVLAFQKAQVQRVELTETLKEQAGEARQQAEAFGVSAEALAADLWARIEGLTGSFEERVKLLEGVMTELTERLPEHAKGIIEVARSQVETRLSRVA